jgi:Zn-dependent membrane protease YugP
MLILSYIGTMLTVVALGLVLYMAFVFALCKITAPIKSRVSGRDMQKIACNTIDQHYERVKKAKGLMSFYYKIDTCMSVLALWRLLKRGNSNSSVATIMKKVMTNSYEDCSSAKS